MTCPNCTILKRKNEALEGQVETQEHLIYKLRNRLGHGQAFIKRLLKGQAKAWSLVKKPNVTPDWKVASLHDLLKAEREKMEAEDE